MAEDPRQQRFAADFAALNAFYAAADGLQRPGGMVIDRDGIPTCDVEAMASWGYRLLGRGEDVEALKTEIRHSEEWVGKHPGEVPFEPPQGEPGAWPAYAGLVPVQTDFLNLANEAFGLRHAFYDGPRRLRRLAALRAIGATSVDLLAYEDDDASRIDLYADPGRAEVVLLEAGLAGFRRRLWLMPETGAVHSRIGPKAWHGRFRTLLSRVQLHVEEIVLGLELDENWTQADVLAALGVLRSLTAKPIWLHFGPGVWWGVAFWRQAIAAGASGLLYQALTEGNPGAPGFRPRADALDTFAVVADELARLGVPAVMFEYALYWPQDQAAAFADLALAVGSYGYGNGGRGLQAYRRPAGVPVPGDAFDLARVQAWCLQAGGAGAEVRGWPITSRLGPVSVQGSTWRLPHTRAGGWPAFRYGDIDMEANAWIVARVEGTWCAGTFEWIRPGQVVKEAALAELGRDQVRVSPMDARWSGPRPGDECYVFLTTRARDGGRSGNERTQVARVQW